MLLCPMCSRRGVSVCVHTCVCVWIAEFAFHHGRGKWLWGWNHHHTLTLVSSPLVAPAGHALEEKSINFFPQCQSLSETYTDAPGLRCLGNLLIHWSAVVTTLHSGMITPHWDLDWRGQLKVVSVKLTYALLGYVSLNDQLTVDLSI